MPKSKQKRAHIRVRSRSQHSDYLRPLGDLGLGERVPEVGAAGRPLLGWELCGDVPDLSVQGVVVQAWQRPVDVPDLFPARAPRELLLSLSDGLRQLG